MEILDDDREPAAGRGLLRPLAWVLYLVICALAGSGIREYTRLSPLAQERNLGQSILLRESFSRFDPASAILGLLFGIATLAIFVAVSRRGGCPD